MGARKKNKNPLYVVTNNGQDVEQATGMFDMWVKKLGLAPLVEALDFFLKMLLDMISSYAMFTVVKEAFDQYLAQIQFLMGKWGLGPVAPYPQQ